MPEFLKNAPAHWIPYTPDSWKKDLIRIPLLINRYKIDVFHYWILLGPLHQCGAGLYHPCKTVGIVHDLGVEFWNVPYLKALKKRPFWMIQKFVSKSVSRIFTVSSHTRGDYITLFSKKESDVQLLYMPNSQPHFYKRGLVSPYFIFLRGGPHKNEKNIVAAFLQFHKTHPSYSLILLGEDSSGNKPASYTKDMNIICENSMDYYHDYLCHASALLFCSFHEGFGIPPIEAMAEGCPLIVSDIPPLRETCSDSAVFVDPYKVSQIADAMSLIIENNANWSVKSFSGGKNHYHKSSETVNRLLKCYENLVS
jgi:glycosyltransferase involved in cell wall biosynthesis